MRPLLPVAPAWMLLALAGNAVLTCSCDKKSSASMASGDRIVADENGFTPASLALAKGTPGSKVAVTFVRTTDKTCATEVVFPELGVKKDLPLNQPVAVDVPTDSARTLTFQCGMAMYKGMLVVK
jgi:plastocyanin domain-containing protein